MEKTKPSLKDSIQQLQKMYNMSYAKVMSYWHEYVEEVIAYHAPCPEEFHILMVSYVNSNALTTFEDFVKVTLPKEGRLKVDETLF